MDRRKLLPTPLVHSGIHSPPEVRDAAYQLWAWGTGRNMAAVADELGVHRMTVWRWSQQDRWLDRYNDDRDLPAPDVRRAVNLTFRVGALDAARFLVDAPNNPHITQAQVKASTEVLHQAGYVPVERIAHIPDHGSTHIPTDLDALTPEERADLERSIIEASWHERS